MKQPSHSFRRQLSPGRWFCAIAVVAVITLSAVSVPRVSGFAPSLSSPRSSHAVAMPMLQAAPDDKGSRGRDKTDIDDSNNSNNSNNSHLENDFWTRRETLSRTASSVLASSSLAGLWSADSALAAEATTSSVATKQEIISKLAGIPTFCLVNGPGSGPNFDGVPFDIYNTDTATATGYFFMSYETALNALKVASDLDSARGDGNIWSTARVKVVPLSVAIQLSLTKRRREAVNEEKGVGGIKVDTIHNLIPSDEGNADAQTLDTSRSKNAKKWETKGRVPLFYIPETRLKKNFYYFDTSSLIDDYKRNHAKEDPSMAFIPEIQLVELIDVFRKAQNSNDWESLRDFTESIRPSQEAREAAIKLLKEDMASPSAPYNFDKVYLVVAAGKK